MRRDRDRFVVLAFCWADILVELDGDGRIVFSAGPLGRLIGTDDARLVGRPLIELIADKDRPLFDGLLAAARRRGRLEGASVRLKGVTSDGAPQLLSGYRLAELGGHFFIGLRKAPDATPTASGRALKRDAESGLYDAQSFASVVKE